MLKIPPILQGKEGAKTILGCPERRPASVIMSRCGAQLRDSDGVKNHRYQRCQKVYLKVKIDGLPIPILVG